jgi:hypothetical protein
MGLVGSSGKAARMKSKRREPVAGMADAGTIESSAAGRNSIAGSVCLSHGLRFAHTERDSDAPRTPPAASKDTEEIRSQVAALWNDRFKRRAVIL